MTDPGETISLAEHGGGAREDLPLDLPLPAPLSASRAPALFLDFDGTLVEIADHPDAVIVDPGLPRLIATLATQLDGRLALVSGRSLAALEGMLGTLDVAVAGSHGGEFRLAGSREVSPLADPLPADVVAILCRFADANGGLLVEPKPFSVAVHYRRHPHARDALLATAAALASARGLKLKHGKQVIELVMPGSDKGSAVAKFMALPAFADTVPLFVGDDVTDEDAFRVADELGGGGILVGDMRQTAAHWRLPDVTSVHDWLAQALGPNLTGEKQA